MRSFLQRGFTLIELLIVIVVLGILAGVLVLTINIPLQIAKGRDAEKKSDLSTIQTALESYRHDVGSYPNFAAGTAGSTALPTGPLATCNKDSQLTGNGGTVYLSHIPCDPSSGTGGFYNMGNYYYSSSDGSSYTLGACLENIHDPAGASIPGGSGTCTSMIYYVVTSQ